MTEYFHPRHGRVPVLQKYSDVWIISVDGSEKSVTPNALKAVEESESSTKRGGASMVTSSLSAELGMSSKTVVRLNAPDTTVELLADSLPMIGRARARHILDNRPDQGYQNWRHLQQCNADHISIDWESFRTTLEENLIEFDYS